MVENSTFRLRYVGARFKGQRLPVDVLTDLPAFRELIVAFAKMEWRNRNPHRQRVPKGFDAGLTFNLIAIESGSAVPVLCWDREVTQRNLPGFTNEIEQVVAASFEEVTGLFSNAAYSIFPSSLPQGAVRALNKFGAALRDDEKIEFVDTNTTSGSSAFVDSHLRRNLIGSLSDRYVAEFEGIGKLLGSVASSIGELGYIVVDTESDYGQVQIPIDNESIRSDFDGAIDQPVELRLRVELDQNDHIASVVEVNNATIIDDRIAAELERCRERLSQVGKLKDGWHDGDGLAPSIEALARANEFLDRRSALCDKYHIYPTDIGGIVFEFRISDWDLSVEFLKNGAVELYGTQIEGDGVVEPTEYPSGITQSFLRAFDKLVGRE